MGSQRTAKGTKKENALQVEKPKQVFVGFYDVFSGHHSSHQDPGWDPKGQPEGPKREMLDM